VAHINKIGAHIAFQGATAKNHALVKAFEQKLQKPIYVSKFCHLTGAIGVCLKMAETSFSKKSDFRKDLHTEKLTAGEYVCGFCNNNCKIKTIELEGETLGWGYLCGRDEGDSAYRKRKASGFDLLRDHRKVFQAEGRPEQEKARRDVNLFREFQHGGIQSVIRRPDFTLARLRNRIQFNALVLREEIFSAGIVSRNSEGTKTPVLKIGLPSTLNMLEYMPLWELFFKRLGFHVIATSTNKSHIKAGKEISGAEFCAPMAEFQGHIMELDLKADFIFYPQIFENAMDKERKAYCYYTNFAVPIIQNIPARDFSRKLISPVLNFYENLDGVIREIYLKLPEEMKAHTTFNKVEEAFLLAWDWFRERKADLLDLFRDQVGAANDIGVVLMGRPYLILNHSLNKGIPNKLADMGIQSFFMDMVPIEEERLDAALDFIQWNHWHYGNLIIKAAEMTAQTPRLFPIYLTAFKCSPDSFILSYFKEIMDYYRKPYLILQLDEHEAGEGYETRLEAAVETFRGFQGAARQDKRPTVNLKKSFEEKTYLLPDYDPLVARLIQAAFQHAGINAMAIEQTPDTFHRSLKINDGQCLPVSALVLGIQHTIQKHELDPERTAYYSNTDCHISCNLPQYPVMIKQTLERLGCGLEKVDVLVGKFLPSDLPLELMYESSMAYMTAGFVQKIMHKVRPRERIPGSTDSFQKAASDKLFRCFLDGGSKEDVFQEVVNGFLKIEMREGPLPQVGLVGDLYVQDNSLFNQNLITEIEKSGAEAVTIPFFDSILLLAEKLFQYMWTDGRYMDLLRSKVAYNTLKLFNRKLAAIAKPILGNGANGLKGNPLDYLNKYSITIWHGGETPENLLKIFYLHENCPDLKFIINVNPIFCCPGLISEAIYKKLEKEIGIPIVSITYDGTQADKNRALKPYLHFAV
jgi:predicted nucleotide-binding protein (sugar kinase/HSP70/actin superfamily)